MNTTLKKFSKIWLRFVCEDMAESAIIFLLVLALMAMNIKIAMATCLAVVLATITIASIEAMVIA
jgi:hypothetical protein